MIKQVTCNKQSTIDFLKKYGVVKSSMKCPGPNINGRRQNNCDKEMVLKEVKDCKDNMTWRCQKVHKVEDDTKKYTVKDVKVSIRQDSWIFDA